MSATETKRGRTRDHERLNPNRVPLHRIWRSSKKGGGKLSYRQIEEKYGLLSQNGMTAYRYACDYERERAGNEAKRAKKAQRERERRRRKKMELANA